MAATKTVTIDGMLIGEITNGVMRNYGTDALGSVVETVLNGVEENTYVYKPYGATLAKTGAAADPAFLWNGGSGYRATALINADYYVRRRIYSTSFGRWTTADPLWPTELPFGYVAGSPVRRSDPSGLGGSDPGGPGSPYTSGNNWVTSYYKVNGIMGTVKLPSCCSTPTGSMIRFSVALTSSGSVISECGVYFMCATAFSGWGYFTIVADNHATPQGACQDCAPLASITVKLEIEDTTHYHCKIQGNSTLPDLDQIYLSPAIKQAYNTAGSFKARVGMNAVPSTGSAPPAYTQASWNSLSLQTGSYVSPQWLSWVPSLHTPSYPGDTFQQSHYSRISQTSPFTGSFNNTDIPCLGTNCPTMTGVTNDPS